MEQLSPKIEKYLDELPDAEAARRFFAQFAERNRSSANRLEKNESLLLDVLTLSSFSPLLAATLLQNPDYVNWLARQKESANVCGKEELLESLARFSLTNSQTEPQVLLARFRRRELLRIYLGDIRRLETITEVTEELSNLADAILEYALRLARQELDNRFGTPLEVDRKRRARGADFCIVALGKLGSKELNYSSDIDLLFLYSGDGSTSGQGARGAVTNREYFIKLAERVAKIVGGDSGEAAYRVDLRLRPHGRIGALAVSLKEAADYYREKAQAWERQILIRARASAGAPEVFKEFFARVETKVYAKDESVADALESVRLSKEKINLQHQTDKGFNVKLGRGGIREIEFIAQALQLAHGGRDRWLCAAHTLISLSRLADRELVSETELTELSGAYDFLRRLEHRLQMEHGLQTHLVPADSEKRESVAQRMDFADASKFDAVLNLHTQNVSRIFARVFGSAGDNAAAGTSLASVQPASGLANDSILQNSIRRDDAPSRRARDLPRQFLPGGLVETGTKETLKRILSSFEKSGSAGEISEEKFAALRRFAAVSPHFAGMIDTNPDLIKFLPCENDAFAPPDYRALFLSELESRTGFAPELAVLRRTWARSILEIAAADVFEKIDLRRAKQMQTELAEASLEAALLIVRRELERRFKFPVSLNFAALGLGKLGGRGMDYGSDLDLVLIYDDCQSVPVNLTHPEFYSRVAEIFVAALSSFTRHGNLYRVDLRLRPDGKNGATSIGKSAFLSYLETRAAIWEWLAYVKLRGVSGDASLAVSTEENARRTVHENARRANPDDLRTETARVRELLEKEKTGGSKAVDIKYGAGGMLDIYFAMRFLQLRDNVPDYQENRSTTFMLEKLRENGSLSAESFLVFAEGYQFLVELDHNLRLSVGRSTRLPKADQIAFQAIVKRMRLESINDLLEKLTFHRLQIRAAYENILG